MTLGEGAPCHLNSLQRKRLTSANVEVPKVKCCLRELVNGAVRNFAQSAKICVLQRKAKARRVLEALVRHVPTEPHFEPLQPRAVHCHRAHVHVLHLTLRDVEIGEEWAAVDEICDGIAANPLAASQRHLRQ